MFSKSDLLVEQLYAKLAPYSHHLKQKYLNIDRFLLGHRIKIGSNSLSINFL